MHPAPHRRLHPFCTTTHPPTHSHNPHAHTYTRANTGAVAFSSRLIAGYRAAETAEDERCRLFTDTLAGALAGDAALREAEHSLPVRSPLFTVWGELGEAG